MKYIIRENHKNDNLSPIIVLKGSKVKLGEHSNDNGPWPNWVYCYSLDGNGEGWTPIQIIHIEENSGTVLEDYSAYELEVNQNDIVEGYNELNGWIWCRNEHNIYGWLPIYKLDELKKKQELF